MSNRLDKLLDTNKNILTLYLTSGYPDKEISNEIAQILLKSNIDILEIGIPFSDPIADGPTIQNTSYKAINSIDEPIIDFTFNTIEKLRKGEYDWVDIGYDKKVLTEFTGRQLKTCNNFSLPTIENLRVSYYARQCTIGT